jgi:sugar phosphate permease
LAGLLFFTVKEPRRGSVDGREVDTKLYSMGQTIRYLLANKTYMLLVGSACFTGLADQGFSSWFPSFLIRVHHLTMIQVATRGGSVKSISGIVGTLIGGFVVMWLGRKGDKWRTITPALTCLLAGPSLLCFFLSPMPTAWFYLVISVALMGFRSGPVFALVQTVVKVRMRAFGAASIFLVGNLFGLGFGPFIVGGMNDLLKPAYGPLSIRYSLISVAATSMVIAGLLLLAATRSVTSDIEKSLMEQ